MSQDIEARLQALEAKIQDLSDREAIRSLRFRYHECINGEELDASPGLFGHVPFAVKLARAVAPN